MKYLDKLILIVYFISTVIIGATSDGLWLVGHKEWGHGLEVFELVLLLCGPLFYVMKY